jgi:dolichyl-phosphate-mannose--protein O-mannosyl transferase
MNDCPDEIIPVLPSHSPFLWVGLFILIVISVIFIYEIWALNKHKPTVSKWFQHFTDKYQWFKLLVSGGLIALIIHWIHGFDLDGRYHELLEKIKNSKR